MTYKSKRGSRALAAYGAAAHAPKELSNNYFEPLIKVSNVSVDNSPPAVVLKARPRQDSNCGRKTGGTMIKFAFEQYIGHLSHRIAAIIDDGDKAAVLDKELNEWERVEEALLEWTQKRDGSPNPYTPAISLSDAVCATVWLTRCIASLSTEPPPCPAAGATREPYFAIAAE